MKVDDLISNVSHSNVKMYSHKSRYTITYYHLLILLYVCGALNKVSHPKLTDCKSFAVSPPKLADFKALHITAIVDTFIIELNFTGEL